MSDTGSVAEVKAHAAFHDTAADFAATASVK